MNMPCRLATQQSVSSTRTRDLRNATINRPLWTLAAPTLVGWADTRHLDGAQRGEFGA